jgi:SAM-dependent methyltransferase
MEKLPSEDYKNEDIEKLEEKFNYYIKDFPLSSEDLHKSFLDVGVHTGEFVQYLRDVIGNKQAIGVEKQVHKIKGKEGFVAADGLKLPFEDESFEIVTAHNYLPMFIGNTSQMQNAILELIRVTKKGGKMMGDIATPESIKEDERDFRDSLGADYSDQDEINFSRDLKGAEDLQVFIQKLREQYTIQLIKRDPLEAVLIVEK